MNIRLTGLSLVMGILFALPSAMATAASPAVDASAQQGADSHDARQHQYQWPKSEEGEGKCQKDRGQRSGGGCCLGHCGHKHGDKKDRHGHHHHHDYAHSIAMQAEALGLSDEQLGKIVRLHLKGDKEAHERLKEKMKANMKAFQKGVSQPVTDDETLRKLGQAYVDSFNEMVTYHIQERKTVRSILTPEQIGKLKDIKTGHEH